MTERLRNGSCDSRGEKDDRRGRLIGNSDWKATDKETQMRQETRRLEKWKMWYVASCEYSAWPRHPTSLYALGRMHLDANHSAGIPMAATTPARWTCRHASRYSPVHTAPAALVPW